MAGEGRSFIDGLFDSVASCASSVLDSYGWILPATVFTLLCIAAMLFLCWIVEDVPLEPGFFSMPRCVFLWSRKRWQRKRS